MTPDKTCQVSTEKFAVDSIHEKTWQVCWS